jgi:hypothetical protein
MKTSASTCQKFMLANAADLLQINFLPPLLDVAVKLWPDMMVHATQQAQPPVTKMTEFEKLNCRVQARLLQLRFPGMIKRSLTAAAVQLPLEAAILLACCCSALHGHC